MAEVDECTIPNSQAVAFIEFVKYDTLLFIGEPYGRFYGGRDPTVIPALDDPTVYPFRGMYLDGDI